MSLAVSRRDNPYLDLVPGMYWPPYVELVIRAGIAERHPSNPRLIRLCDFDT